MPDQHDEPIREPLGSPADPALPLRQRAEQHRQVHVLRTLFVVLLLLVVTTLLLSQGSVSLPPPLTHLLTPVPTATPRPGHFIASSWERVSLPPGRNLVPPFPVPNDPTTLYTCAAGLPDTSGRLTDGPATLWVTHDAGHSWTPTPLALPNGVYCSVVPGQDGSAALVLTISTAVVSDTDSLSCAHEHFFTSDDGGATWTEIRHMALVPAGAIYSSCDLWATARHAYLSTFYQLTTQDEGQTLFERSDDGGHTWTRADAGLPARGYDIRATGPDALVAVQSISSISTAFWMSTDAGRSWRHTGTIPDPYGGQFLTGADADPAHPACACFFVTGGVNTSPHHLYLYTSSDGARWMPLPPLPVPGTTTTYTGLFRVIGLTVDGRLLALGADPAAGVLGEVSTTPPALWAWNTHRRRWEVAAERTPCTHLDSCFVISPWLSRGVGPDGTTVATWAWLEQGNDVGLPSDLYRVFVPTQ